MMRANKRAENRRLAAKDSKKRPSTLVPSCCWWKKSCISWYGKYPVIYRVSYMSGGAWIFFPRQYLESSWFGIVETYHVKIDFPSILYWDVALPMSQRQIKIYIQSFWEDSFINTLQLARTVCYNSPRYILRNPFSSKLFELEHIWSISTSLKDLETWCASITPRRRYIPKKLNLAIKHRQVAAKLLKNMSLEISRAVGMSRP